MTSPSPLERVAGPGNVLAKEAPDAQEFDGLVRSGLARLKDAEREANSLDSRFDLAYSAAHGLCLAALRHHGFRPTKRYIVFQVLPDTLGLGLEVWRILSKLIAAPAVNATCASAVVSAASTALTPCSRTLRPACTAKGSDVPAIMPVELTADLLGSTPFLSWKSNPV